MTHGARARILPGALRHNLSLIRERTTNCRIMAAIKGNAYGHGLLTAARAFAAADSLAIARLSEAATLRAAGNDQPIVLLPGIMNREELQQAQALRCELVVHSEAQLQLLDAAPPSPTIAWLKVDTGMHRLGFQPGAVADVLGRLRAARSVAEVRLMTHLACADDPHSDATAAQIAAFQRVTEGFVGDVSIANSAAILGGQRAFIDPQFWGHRGATWVRPGIALYGISPYPERCGADLGLRPAMQFETRLLDVKRVRAGAPVGYGGGWSAPADGWIGIIAAGYGDGYTRFLPSGTPVLVNGRRVPLAGTVSMDLAAVFLGTDAADSIGDPVVLWGPGLPVEEVARHAGTIAYQLVTGVMHREEPAIGESSPA